MRAIYFHGLEEAARYLQEEQRKNEGVMLFSTVSQVIELSRIAPETAILCSTAGEYTPEGYKNGAVTGFVYALDEAEAVEIGHPPIKSANALRQAYGKVQDNPNAFMLLLCDGLSAMEETVMTTLFFLPPEFKIVGGSAGDNLQFKETLIYLGNRRVRHLAVFFNSRRRTSLLKENIYAPSGTTLLVTKADALKRTVHTFNDRPASEEYARLLGVPETELERHFMNHPFGKIYENDMYIASPMKVNPDKSITLYAELMSNTFVHLLQPADPLQVVKETVASAPFKPSFVFSVHCILRSLMFLEKNCWADYHQELSRLCPNVTGFISYGEQYYKRHANQTMVLLLME